MGGTQLHPGGAAPQHEHLSRDGIFEVLGNRRRRMVCHYLKREDEPADLTALSRQVSAWEMDTEVDEVMYEDRKRVYTALRQTHLPKMDDIGVIDYDPDRGTIEPTPALENVELYLDVVSEHEIPRSEFYLGLSFVAGALVAVAWADILPVDAVSPLALAALIVVAFGVASTIDVYYDRVRRLGTHERPPEC